MAVEIVPDGDLLITLTPSPQPFAPWPESDDDDENDTNLDADGTTASDTSDALGTDAEEQLSVPDVTRFRVSSKHMCSASRRFRQMLTGPWLEATRIHPDGLRHVDMEGFDPEAFAIILNLIHGLGTEVPRAVEFDLLARICVVIDDLECHRQEDVHTYSVIWGTDLDLNRDVIQTMFLDRDLILSIFISSVLDLPALFKASTSTAIERSTGHVPTLGLPVRDKIVDAILERRTVLLSHIIDGLHRELRVRSPFTRPLAGCSSVCGSVLLGCLLRAMLDCEVYPQPCPPFTGLRLLDLVSMMRDIRTPMWFYKDHAGGDLKWCQCTVLEDLVHPILDGVSSEGLDLEKVLPKRLVSSR